MLSVSVYFDGSLLTWLELAGLYDQSPKLLRADALFEPSAAWTASPNNVSGT